MRSRNVLYSADPVDVGAQNDLFGATALAVASSDLGEQNEGGYRGLDPLLFAD